MTKTDVGTLLVRLWNAKKTLLRGGMHSQIVIILLLLQIAEICSAQSPLVCKITCPGWLAHVYFYSSSGSNRCLGHTSAQAEQINLSHVEYILLVPSHPVMAFHHLVNLWPLKSITWCSPFTLHLHQCCRLTASRDYECSPCIACISL